jgi:hypothetical protein
MYLTDATILSEEGSREVLEEISRPPEDTPERRRTFAGARMMAAYWRKQEATANDASATDDASAKKADND